MIKFLKLAGSKTAVNYIIENLCNDVDKQAPWSISTAPLRSHQPQDCWNHDSSGAS